MNDYQSRLTMMMEGVQILINAFSAPLFIAFTLMCAFAVAYGIKRLVLE